MATGKTNKILPVGSDSHSTTVVDMDLCPICLDEFRDPRVLPCQHSFCMQCLQNHVDSHKSDIFRKGVFHCPSCRALTYPTYKFKPVSGVCLRKIAIPKQPRCFRNTVTQKGMK
uniref:RING-type domain-containing protein n=1 Tax=Octopus bimaculoides TaxID=37653 RepID=A0A0L8HG23_OCTBM